MNKIFRNLIENKNKLLPIDNILKNQKDLYIFGAGGFGEWVGNEILNSSSDFTGFIDNNKNIIGQNKIGKRVYGLHEVDKENSYILICSSYWGEIQQQLEKEKFKDYLVLQKRMLHQFEILRNAKDYRAWVTKNEQYLLEVYENLADEQSKKTFLDVIYYRSTGDLNLNSLSDFEQYFYGKCLPEDEGYIIDGGAYIGDTALDFLKRNENITGIYCFEPALVNYKELEKNMNSKIIPIKAGLASTTTKSFMKTADSLNEGYSISNEGNEIVEIIRIDDFMEDRDTIIDILKMDIEGFELDALKGARNTIQKDRPKLMICLYHKYEDMYEIPLYILQEFKDLNYKLAVGNHINQYASIETVLYCY